MRTNHADRIAHFPFLADCEGDDRRAIPSEVIFSSGL